MAGAEFSQSLMGQSQRWLARVQSWQRLVVVALQVQQSMGWTKWWAHMQGQSEQEQVRG